MCGYDRGILITDLWLRQGFLTTNIGYDRGILTTDVWLRQGYLDHGAVVTTGGFDDDIIR